MPQISFFMPSKFLLAFSSRRSLFVAFSANEHLGSRVLIFSQIFSDRQLNQARNIKSAFTEDFNSR